jgi:hypothetical protein
MEDEGKVFIKGALNKRKCGALKKYLPKTCAESLLLILSGHVLSVL